MTKTTIEMKDKKLITKDWLNEFPDFKEYKPMHIVRRNGPFLCGIYLQTFSSGVDYEPLFHIHNLMIDFPVVSLGSPFFLLNKLGAKEIISLKTHREIFQEYANRLKAKVLLLENEYIRADDIVFYIKNYLNHSNNYPFDSLRDIILTFFWCNRLEEVEQYIYYGKNIIAQWPDGVKKRFGGEEGWEKYIRTLMNYNQLTRTIDNQIVRYKLSALTDYGFID